MICKIFSEYVYNATCIINKINQTDEEWNMDVFLQPQVEIKDLIVTTNFELKSNLFSLKSIFSIIKSSTSLFYRGNSDTAYKPVLGLNNYTIDICAFNSGGLKSLFVDLFVSDLRKYSNLLNPCPFKVPDIRSVQFIFRLYKHFLVQGHMFCKHWILDTSNYPSIMPIGEYMLRAIYYTQRKSEQHILLDVYAFADLKPRK